MVEQVTCSYPDTVLWLVITLLQQDHEARLVDVISFKWLNVSDSKRLFQLVAY